jgi:hypothetical protein
MSFNYSARRDRSVQRTTGRAGIRDFLFLYFKQNLDQSDDHAYSNYGEIDRCPPYHTLLMPLKSLEVIPEFLAQLFGSRFKLILVCPQVYDFIVGETAIIAVD